MRRDPSPGRLHLQALRPLPRDLPATACSPRAAVRGLPILASPLLLAHRRARRASSPPTPPADPGARRLLLHGGRRVDQRKDKVEGPRRRGSPLSGACLIWSSPGEWWCVTGDDPIGHVGLIFVDQKGFWLGMELTETKCWLVRIDKPFLLHQKALPYGATWITSNSYSPRALGTSSDALLGEQQFLCCNIKSGIALSEMAMQCCLQSSVNRCLRSLIYYCGFVSTNLITTSE
ncbi:hypothetical protein U9M48_005312 [Paspalum notatum var. saurae]|uniref:Uncharacterized protein n=1 Tax=Paspalum notatum var. saurae TaxID=547442 RepID=A0AAQ3SJS8_PASNO